MVTFTVLSFRNGKFEIFPLQNVLFPTDFVKEMNYYVERFGVKHREFCVLELPKDGTKYR